MARVRLCLAMLFISVGSAAYAALTPPLESRELISTGDRLPGFGRVGTPNFFVNGIDDRGRVLFGSHLSDGRLGLFLAIGQQVTALWTSSPGSPGLHVHNARISPGGRVLAFASSGATFELFGQSLYEVRPDGLTLLVDQGATTSDGHQVCGLRAVALNDRGDVAVYATAAPVGECERGGGYRAIYRLTGGRLQRVGEPDHSYSVGLGGVSDSGQIVISRGTDIVELDGDTARTLVAPDQPGPSGYPLRSLERASLGASGKVAFSALENGVRGLYLLDGAVIRRIVGNGDATSGGETISFVESAAVSGDGEVVALVYLADAPDGSGTAVIRYAADGRPGATLSGASGPVINRAGQVALTRTLPGRTEVARWNGGRPTAIVDSADVAPGGGHYLHTGFSFGGPYPTESVCLEASGRAAVLVWNSAAEQGLVCVDADGAHVTARAAQFSDASALAFLLQCEFAAGDLYFAGVPRDSGTALYRLTGNAHQRMLGAGDQIADGGRIEYLSGITSAGGYFVANDEGALLALAIIDGEQVLVLRGAGDAWSRLPVPPIEAPNVDITSAGLTADERAIAMVVSYGDDDYAPFETTVVLTDRAAGRVVARTRDAQVPGGPYTGFGTLLVRGSHAVFTGNGRSTRLIIYDATADVLRLLPLPIEDQDRYPQLIDLTGAGEVLYEVSDDAGGRLRKLIDSAGTVQLLSQYDPGDPLPIAVSDAGHVLLGTRQAPLGALRQTISLAGPAASAACPGVTTAPTPVPRATEDDGCQIGGAPSPSAWPLLALALLLGTRTLGRAVSEARPAPRPPSCLRPAP